MLKLIIFTIYLCLSPTFGLVGTLLQVENDCYSGCHANYVDNLSNLDACKKGCNYKLYNEKCTDQCKLLSIDEQIQASCLIGCSMNHPEIKKSIILIRLRQRPSSRFSSSSNSNPVEIFNDIKTIPLLKSPKINSLNDKDKLDHFQQLIKTILNKSNQFICKQPKLSIWIILSIFILSSAILSYMIVSLCCRTPKHHNLSIRAEELIFEKEIIQPDSPVKVKLTNI